MTELCRNFGVSRKTGHKWIARHAVGGIAALAEHSRAPKSVTCRTSDEVERPVCTEKRLRSTWGPKKIPPRGRGLTPVGNFVTLLRSVQESLRLIPVDFRVARSVGGGQAIAGHPACGKVPDYFPER